MDTRIIGNATYSCSACGCQHAIDATALKFEMGSPDRNDPENEGRYESVYLHHCISCNQATSIAFEVWEFPVGATNYCYHSELGSSNIQCEFAIEYYHAEGAESDEREATSSYSDDSGDEDHDDYEGPEDYEGTHDRFNNGALDDFDVSDD